MIKHSAMAVSACLLAACGPAQPSNEASNATIVADNNSSEPAPGNQTASNAAETASPAATQVRMSIIGEWADRACVEGDGDRDGDGYPEEGANFRIDKDGYTGFEWGCDIKPKLTPDQTSYKGTATCYGDGQDDTPQPISFEILPDGRLKMKDIYETAIMKRCD